MIAWITGLLGGKIPAAIIVVLGLGMVVLGATTYFTIEKNGAQKQFIETLQGDMKALKADMTVAKAARDKSDRDLREFQVAGAALTAIQDKETRRLQAIIAALKQHPVGAMMISQSEIMSGSPLPGTPQINKEVPLTDEQFSATQNCEQANQIECLDRLVPGPILDDLFGVRDVNPN